jgi:hypothetical protein
MSNRALRWAPACGLAFATVACAKDSSDLTTRDIAAFYYVTVNDKPNDPKQEITIEANLKDASAAGADDKVNLTGSDTLFVTTEKNDNLPMNRDTLGHYLATIPGFDRSTFTFHLKRGSSESISVLTLPDHLAMTDSPEGKIYSASATVHFAWSNKAEHSDLALSASHHVCNGITLSNDTVDNLPFPDSGTLDVPVSKLFSSGTPAAECVDISIERTVDVPADTALAYGSSSTGKRTDRFKIQVQ